jgi:hypothetical protein
MNTPITVQYGPKLHPVTITGNLRGVDKRDVKDPGTGDIIYSEYTVRIETKNVTLDPPKEGTGSS